MNPMTKQDPTSTPADGSDPAFTAGPLPTKDKLLKALIERLGFTMHEAQNYDMPNSPAARCALETLDLAMTIGARHPHSIERSYSGMSMRQYAAIKLKVPDSGTDWLDAMIRVSLRDGFAAKAMSGVIANWDDAHKDDGERLDLGHDGTCNGVSQDCYAMADAMLKARDAS
jgi:hypothetical protein